MATSTSSKIGVLFVAAVAVAIATVVLTAPEGPDRLPSNPEDDQVFVDLAAVWSPQRTVTVSWQLGALIQGERFTIEDRGRWGIRRAVNRGTEVVLLVEQALRGGELGCEIAVDGQIVAEKHVDGTDPCRVEWVV